MYIEASGDVSHTITPVLDTLLSTLCIIQDKSCLDKGMVKYTCHAVDKVVMLKRPIKKGFRIWSYSCSCCSYMCTFQVYQGSQVVVVTGKKTPTEGLANCDLMAGLNHVLYCENFYSSGPLADALVKQQIFIVGTCHRFS